jgi:hypothetical protein
MTTENMIQAGFEVVRAGFIGGRNTMRTLFFCQAHDAYYLLSTTGGGQSLVFPAKDSGDVIVTWDVFEREGVTHEEAVAAFLNEDPAEVLARLDRWT